MPRPKKDFTALMNQYNTRYRSAFGNVDGWLRYLRGRFSIRSIARLAGVDRTVLARRMEDL